MNLKVSLSRFRFTEDSLYFKGVGLPENKHHEVTVNFLKKINPDKVTSKNSGRCYEFIISKAESAAEFWPSLTSDKKKPHWLKVDFNKWKDDGSDDDSEAGGDMGAGGMPGMFNLQSVLSVGLNETFPFLFRRNANAWYDGRRHGRHGRHGR